MRRGPRAGDALPDLEPAHLAAEGFDRAREVPPPDIAVADHALAVRALAGEDVEAVHRGGLDADQHVVRAGLGVRHLAVLQDAESTLGLVVCRAHHRLLAAPSRAHCSYGRPGPAGLAPGSAA